MTLRVEKINYERAYVPILENISFKLLPGEALEIYGKNGSGKTTLLRLIAGILELQEGSIFWKDKPLHQSENYKNKIFYIGHKSAIKSTLTVLENLKFNLALKKLFYSEKDLLNTLEKVGLDDFAHKQAALLSAGQTKRLSFAQLILSQSSLFILDEPLTSLDQTGNELITNLLNEELLKQTMIIAAVHQPLKLKTTTKKIFLDEHTYV